MVGVLWADAWRVASPAHFDPQVSLSLLAAPVIGGLGSIGGAIAGAVVLYLPISFLSPGSQAEYQLALGGVLMVGVLMLYPTGIAGLAQRLWQAFLDRIDRELPPPSGATGPLLEAQDVALRFGGVRALNGVSVHLEAGEIVGLIGTNGAGKSTLINAISGVLRPDRGSIRLLGEEVADLPPEVRAGLGLGRSFQSAHLFPGLTVRETVEAMIGSRAGIGILASMSHMPWARRTEVRCAAEAAIVIERMGLTAWADTLTADLSTGTRRICDLALQVAAKPKVLLLDEPTAGVAQRETEAFGPLLRRIRSELDCAILIVEHDMPLLMGLCDRIYAMAEGRVIAEGTPEAIRQDPQVIASYLGTDEVAITRSGPRRRRPARARV
jgi:ABC-type branched-subunit amino acid transport system ATPase component